MARHSKFKSQQRIASGESLRRPSPKRKPNKRILIVCEGEVTEPTYFKFFVKSLNLQAVDVQICGEECDSSPISVVKYAEKKARDEGDYEAVFCVFDRDSHASYERAISKLLELNKSNKFPAKFISSILSIPCFELWFILHFNPHRKPYHKSGNKSPCDNLISDLKKIDGFEIYEKTITSVQFELLFSKTADAIKNSKLTLDASKKEGEENPSTLAHELIEYLLEAKAEADTEALKSRSPIL